MQNKILPVLFAACFITNAAFAKDNPTDTANVKKLPPLKKFYIGTAMDGGIFSTATIQHTTATTTTNTTGTLRFSGFLNTGITFNFNLSRHFGVYTGVDIKNIGFITQNAAGATVKQRTYNIGAPIGIKIGNMRPKSTYVFFGGGADVPINYKQKTFVVRNEKTKFSDWFSNATPMIMPYVFFGLAITRGITFKLQYYPNNFLNPNYDQNGESFNGYDVHLFLLCIGYAIPISTHHDMVEKQLDDLKAGKELKGQRVN